MRKKIIKIPIYIGQLVIIQYDNPEDLINEYRLSNLVNKFDAITFRDHKLSGYTRYVAAFGKNCTPSIITHESFHVVSMIFYDRDIEYDNENDEPAAYLIGWISRQIFDFLDIG